MIKLIIAPDKFKGSLTGDEFCEAVEKGIRKHLSEVLIIRLPLADGGDGTMEVLSNYLEGEICSVEVHHPLVGKIHASYLYSESKKAAYIEMAQASGVRLLKDTEKNPMETSSFGTGELIADALNKGVVHIILTIGGSATNDAGMGMARALGYRFLDKDSHELDGKGKDLLMLHSVDDTHIHPRLKLVKFDVACDVDNPLFGPDGAAYIYASQKGASSKEVRLLDVGLQNFNAIVKRQFKMDLQNIAGAGAAGGLGAGSILFLNARLQSGIELIKKEADFKHAIIDADWVITGEGKLDQQTFSGKVIKGVSDSLTNQKLAVFCGVNECQPSEIRRFKIEYLKEISSFASDSEDSLKNAGRYLVKTAEEFTLKCLKGENQA